MTSALIVLPVPESPANSAVIPMPRAPPGRMCHSPSTRSRKRARSASAAQARPCGGQEDEVVPADPRLDASGQPLQAGGVLLAGAEADVGRGHRPAGQPGGDDRCLGGAADLPCAKAVLAHRRRDVELGAAVEGGRPQPGAARRREPRRLDDVRRTARPRRVPGADAVQHQLRRRAGQPADRIDMRLGEHIERPGDEEATSEAGLADRGGDDVVDVRRRRHAREVDDDGRHTGCMGRVDGEVDGSRLPVVDVHEGVGVGDGTRHRGGDRLVGRRDIDQHWLQDCVRRVGTEHVGRHAIGDAERPGEERSLRFLHVEQAGCDEAATLLDASPAGRARRGDAAQSERQPDADAAAGDVVVEVAVVALEAVVDVGRHRREEDAEVELVEVEARGSGAQPERGARGCGLVGHALDLDPTLTGDFGRDPHTIVVQQLVDLLVTQVEAEERVLRRRVDLPASSHDGGDTKA